jgi:hypothetical protein
MFENQTPMTRFWNAGRHWLIEKYSHFFYGLAANAQTSCSFRLAGGSLCAVAATSAGLAA